MRERDFVVAARAMALMRKTGISVIYLEMGFQRDLSDLGPADSPNRLKHLPLAVGTMRERDC